MTDDEEVERIWTNFWVPILYPAGYESVASDALDLEQLKKELYDFRVMMKEVSLVYDHVTGGKFSKITTPASFVIEAAEEHYRKQWEWLNTPIETFKTEPE